jgi:hypothetical protein
MRLWDELQRYARDALITGIVTTAIFIWRRRKMDKDILEGKIGEKGSYDLEFKAGSLSLTVAVDVGLAKAGLKVEVPSGQIIDALEKAIPGDWDKIPLAGLKELLKK